MRPRDNKPSLPQVAKIIARCLRATLARITKNCRNTSYSSPPSEGLTTIKHCLALQGNLAERNVSLAISCPRSISIGFVGDMCFTTEIEPAVKVVSMLNNGVLANPGAVIPRGKEAVSLPHLVEGFECPPRKAVSDGYTRWFRSISISENFSYTEQFAAAALLKTEVDVLFGNLETPLCDGIRRQGMFTACPTFAGRLRNAGFDVLGIANNHAFDAGYEGLKETMQQLAFHGIRQCGYGRSVISSDAIAFTYFNGVRIAWICVTQKCNCGLASSAATISRDGILPMDPAFVCNLIRVARTQADLVIVTPHWSWDESNAEPEAYLVECAHLFVDSGADIVVGSGSHVVQGCEAYRGRLICYCLGNYIFGHDADNWGDNLMLKVHFGNGQWQAEFIPISGRGEGLFSPYVLEADRATAALERLRLLSRPFGASVRISGNRGHIGFVKEI